MNADHPSYMQELDKESQKHDDQSRSNHRINDTGPPSYRGPNMSKRKNRKISRGVRKGPPRNFLYRANSGLATPVVVELGGVAIYRPFGEFRRANSYCHLYGAQGLGQ
ncbi:hypothetical protein TNCV_3351411 [Trichonephila clavipes]|nr:hypothetical protein TNCV_3351411 [Trichonephila clavipes]